MKRIISAIAAFTMIAAALFGFTGISAVKASPTYEVPEGYEANEYTKLRAFMDITDGNGVSNMEKIAQIVNAYWNHFDPSDPHTWMTISEHINYGIHWEWGDELPRHTYAIVFDETFGGADNSLEGVLDLREFAKLRYLLIQNNSIAEVKTEGCEQIRFMEIKDAHTKKISWNYTIGDIAISIESSGDGYIDLYADDYYWMGTGEDGEMTDYSWFINARAISDSHFVGWYDANGELVSNEPCYKFYEGNDWAEYDGCPPPYGTHLNLIARFEAEEEPTPVPTEVPTEEPTAAPTEEPTAVPTDEPTAAPTDEPTAAPTAASEEPAPSPIPDPPKPPATGAIAVYTVGVAAIASGAAIAIKSRKKND